VIDEGTEQLVAAMRAAKPEIFRRVLDDISTSLSDYRDDGDPVWRMVLVAELEREIDAVMERWLEGRDFTDAEAELFRTLPSRRAASGKSLEGILEGIPIAIQTGLKVLEETRVKLPSTPSLDAAYERLRQRAVVVQAEVVALVMHDQRTGAAQPRLDKRVELMADILTGAELEPEPLLIEVGHRLRLYLREQRGVLLVARFDSGAAPSAAETAARSLSRSLPRAFALPGLPGRVDHWLVVAPSGEAAWTAIEERAVAVCGEHRVHVLRSHLADSPSSLRRAYRAAVDGLPLVPLLAGIGRVVKYEDVATYSLILPASAEKRRYYATWMLSRIMELPVKEQRRHVATIRALDMHGGDRDDAAASLGVQPRTLQKRMRRIRELTTRSAATSKLYVAAMCYLLEWGGDEGSTPPPSDSLGSAGESDEVDPEFDSESPEDDASLYASPSALLESLRCQLLLRTCPASILSSLTPEMWRSLTLREVLRVRLTIGTTHSVEVARMAARRARKSLARWLSDGPTSGLGLLLGIPATRPRARGLGARLQGWRTVAAGVATPAGLLDQPALALVLAVALALGIAQPTESRPSGRPGQSAPQGQAAGRYIGGNDGEAQPSLSQNQEQALVTNPPIPIPRGPGRSLTIGPDPSSETIDDSALYGATPSPNYGATDHTVMAIGRGHRCDCYVVFRSQDGGASWQAAPGPPEGEQIVLPPGYPADPAIFVANNPATQLPDFMSPGFGQSFSPLITPPGWLALPADYDRGNQVVYTSAEGGVWSTDLRTQAIQPLMVDQPGRFASIAAPPPGQPSSLFILASPTATAVGVPRQPPDPVATAEGALQMLGCAGLSGCDTASRPALGTGPFELALSASFGRDHAMVAYGNYSALISEDAGRSYSPLGSSFGSRQILSMALASGEGDRPYVYALVADGQHAIVYRRRVGEGSWEPTGALPASAKDSSGPLLALSERRLIRILGDGLICTADGGISWRATCPAE
jgi:sugar diacid utilization regulator